MSSAHRRQMSTPPPIVMSSPSHQSILVIGASGRSGIEIIRSLLRHPSKPLVHAFCRDPKKMSLLANGIENYTTFQSVIKGNARDPKDLIIALSQTHPNVVIVSIGNGDNVSKTDIRTASAMALVQVLTSHPEFSEVKVVVVSSTGAGASTIKVGMGFGKLIEFYLRHILKDHNGQESAFLCLKDRAIIVRATALTDNKPTGKTEIFDDTARNPSIHIDRSDLAAWIVKQVCDEPPASTMWGRTVNITGLKK